VSASTGTPAERTPLRRRFASVDRQVLLLWLAFIIVIPASRVVSTSFPSGNQLDAITTLGLFLVVIAFGQGFVILTGGIDLSVPAIVASASYLCAWQTERGTSPVVAIILALGIAAVIGAANGFGVAFLRIPPFIMTLAMGTIVTSALVGLNSGQPAREGPTALVKLFGEGTRLGPFPVALYFLVGAVLVGFAIQSLTSYGRRVYALGSSERTAEISGMRVRLTRASAYVVAAVAYGIGAMMLLGFTGNARIEIGQEYLLPSIAAVLVGGTAIAGGRGLFLGTVAGGLLLTAISVDISASNFDEGWKQVLYGAIVLGTLMLSKLATRGFGFSSFRRGRGPRAAERLGNEIRQTGAPASPSTPISSSGPGGRARL
jgi:ribose transport system permease protein